MFYSVYEQGNSYRAFSLPKQWDREHVGVPKQSCEGSTPFLCQRKARSVYFCRWDWRGCTTHSQTTLSFRFERKLNAINTDFELKINNLSVLTVHNKLPRHSKVRKIAEHSKESTWTYMEMTSYAPKKFGGGGKLLSIERYMRKISNFSALPD